MARPTVLKPGSSAIQFATMTKKKMVATSGKKRFVFSSPATDEQMLKKPLRIISTKPENPLGTRPIRGPAVSATMMRKIEVTQAVKSVFVIVNPPTSHRGSGGTVM
jgi:hypothetical protein